MKVSLNQNIRDHRKRLQLTQEQLAEAMSVSVATISKWERGGISPDLETLAEIFFFSVYVVSSIILHYFHVDKTSIDEPLLQGIQ